MGGVGSGRRRDTTVVNIRRDPPIFPLPNLYRWTCKQCGVEQAMDEETQRVLRRSSATFFCVHGHQWHYPQGKGEADKLRDQIAEERRQRQRAEQRLAEKQDEVNVAQATATRERNRANGYKGHATRITKRAKAGVCPCCNRSFENLRRHMDTKHPTFTPQPLEVIEGGKVA